MKKFCSTCGNQLELSQRACTKCGTGNPFFVPAFTLLSDQRDSLEKLRLEKERIEAEKARIEKELAEIELAQKEFERQEELRKKIEALESQQAERMERERLLLEQAERERAEAANLKKEIQRVKEEAGHFNYEVINPVAGLNKEVKQEQEMPVQAEPVINTVVTPPVVNTVTPPMVTEETPVTHVYEPDVNGQEAHTATEPAQPQAGNRMLKIALGAAIAMGVFVVYFFFTQLNKPATELSTANSTEQRDKVVDTMLSDEARVENKDTVVQAAVKVSPAVLTTTKPAEAKKTVAETPAVNEKPKSRNTLSEAKIRHDLNGKKVSGCGVSIASESELHNVSNIVLVEKTAQYVKYKCQVKIVQGSDTYTAQPYLYYREDGSFIKLDGTNCE